MVLTRREQKEENAVIQQVLAKSLKEAPKRIAKKRSSRKTGTPESNRARPFRGKQAHLTSTTRSVRSRALEVKQASSTKNTHRLRTRPKKAKAANSAILSEIEDIVVEEVYHDDKQDDNYRPGKSRAVRPTIKEVPRRSGRVVSKPDFLVSQRTTEKKRKNLPVISIRKLGKKTRGKVQKLKTVVTIRRVKWWRIPLGTLRKNGIKGQRLPPGYWPFPERHFKLGHNAWEHTRMPEPTEAEVRDVHRRLTDYNATFSVKSFVGRPAHAGEGSASVDNLIQTILSQSTGNLNAIDSHSRLCNAFPFEVAGRKYVGKMPDWHKIRFLPQEELETVLQPAGYQIGRAKAIKAILDKIWLENTRRRECGEIDYPHDLNPPDACDFVPGLLSIDYLESPKDISNNELLGRLLEFPMIGPKSAMCIMDFAYKRPSFAVDTHVLRFCQWLNWVPMHASEEQAAMFLHNVIPDDIKFDLHNQIWTHCANESTREREGGTLICPFCGANPPPKNKDFSDYKCPVADLLVPLSKRWLDRNGNSKYQELTEEERAAREAKRLAQEERKRSQEEKKAAKAEESQPPTQADEAATDIISSPEASQVSIKTKKWGRTVDYAKMTPSEAAEAGYLLWEFRPLDNSFMQDWGTFGQLPRYKWEKPDLMDADVAVTPEYADGVLAGRIPHKWIKEVGAEGDIIPTAALASVAEEKLVEQRDADKGGGVAEETAEIYEGDNTKEAI